MNDATLILSKTFGWSPQQVIDLSEQERELFLAFAAENDFGLT